MTSNDWIQVVLYFAVLAALAKPLGWYMARVYQGESCCGMDRALGWLERSRATLVDWPPTYWILTAAYAHLGRLDEAQAVLSRLLDFAPYTSIAGVETVALRSDGRFELIIDGLRKVGLT